MEWVAYWMGNLAIFKILAYSASIGLIASWIIFLFTFSAEQERRAQSAGQQRIAEQQQARLGAWQVINSAQGQGGSAGRVEALELLVKQGESLAGLTVAEAYLTGLYLPDATVTDADLHGSTLIGASFQRSSLVDTDLSNTDLSSAHLEYANMTDADLREAVLIGARLQEANLTGADLRGAELGGISLTGAAEESDAAGRTKDPEATETFRSNFEGTILYGTRIEGTDLVGTEGLTQEQVNESCGDADTLLPSGLHAPEAWGSPEFKTIHGCT